MGGNRFQGMAYATGTEAPIVVHVDDLDSNAVHISVQLPPAGKERPLINRCGRRAGHPCLQGCLVSRGSECGVLLNDVLPM